MSQIKAFLFSVLVLLSFSACSGEKTVHWKQEVQLQDGRVIEVERVSKQKGPLFPENVIIEYEQTLSFVNPDTKEKVIWAIPQGLRPKMLDFEKGIPYFVFGTGSVADYNTWDCPNPPFLVFRYENGQWPQKPFDILPAQFTVPNLLGAAHSADKLSEDGLVTLYEFKQYLKKSSIPSVRVISREKIHPIAKGCHPDVLVKQGRESEINVKYKE